MSFVSAATCPRAASFASPAAFAAAIFSFAVIASAIRTVGAPCAKVVVGGVGKGTSSAGSGSSSASIVQEETTR